MHSQRIVLHHIFPDKPNTRNLIRASYYNLRKTTKWSPQEVRSCISQAILAFLPVDEYAFSDATGC